MAGMLPVTLESSGLTITKNNNLLHIQFKFGQKTFEKYVSEPFGKHTVDEVQNHFENLKKKTLFEIFLYSNPDLHGCIGVSIGGGFFDHIILHNVSHITPTYDKMISVLDKGVKSVTFDKSDISLRRSGKELIVETEWRTIRDTHIFWAKYFERYNDCDAYLTIDYYNKDGHKTNTDVGESSGSSMMRTLLKNIIPYLNTYKYINFEGSKRDSLTKFIDTHVIVVLSLSEEVGANGNRLINYKLIEKKEISFCSILLVEEVDEILVFYKDLSIPENKISLTKCDDKVEEKKEAATSSSK